MAPQNYQLVIRSGPNPGRIFDLNKNEISIGRDLMNDIVINDAEVSRKHARLISQAGGYVLEDTGSTNGTFVSGQRLMGPHLLRPGELILLGENVSLTYEPTHFDPNATVASSTVAPAVPVMPSTPPRQQPYSPPPQPAYTPPPSQAYTPPLQQAYNPPPSQAMPPPYQGPFPANPEEAYPPLPQESNRRTWIIAGAGCLVVLLCLLVVGAFVFDYLNLYCSPPFNLVFSPCP